MRADTASRSASIPSTIRIRSWITLATLVCSLDESIAASGCPSIKGIYVSERDQIRLLNEGVNGNGFIDPFPNVTSSEGCCTACTADQFCNFWRFCKDDKGCQIPFRPGSDRPVPKNFCTLQRADVLYEFAKARALTTGPAKGYISGKIESHAPPKPQHPPAVKNEWKCTQPFLCNFDFLLPGFPAPRCGLKKCTSKKCKAVRGLYDTPKILDAEVNSHADSFLPAYSIYYPKVTSAADCCSACSAKKGCDVWNYCWDPLGCGKQGSCSAFNKKFPFSSTPTKGNHTKPVRGPYLNGPDCTPDDRFPIYFCILREAGKDLRKLRPSGTRDSYSWTSGKLAKTPKKKAKKSRT